MTDKTKKNNNLLILPVPPGMGAWVKSEAAQLKLSFMAEIREVDPTAPGHDFEEEIEVLPLPKGPRLRLV